MLNDLQVKSAKPKTKPYKLADQLGLHLVVYPHGSKLWQMRYRFDGKERTASLGKYPDVTMSKARDKRDLMRKQLADDTDPVAAQQLDKMAKKIAKEQSFEAVANAWYDSWSPARSQRHAAYVKRRLAADVFPVIGTRPITAIKAPELVRTPGF